MTTHVLKHSESHRDTALNQWMVITAFMAPTKIKPVIQILNGSKAMISMEYFFILMSGKTDS